MTNMIVWIAKVKDQTTVKVQIWTPHPDRPEHLFEWLEEVPKIDRSQIIDVELDEENIDSDDEGNRLVTYLVEVVPGVIE